MEKYQCTGNCLNCLPAQRAYCASQHSFSNMKVLDRMMDEIMAMRGEVKAMSEKIEAIQNNEALVFSTSGDDEMPVVRIAQGGGGAEE